MGYTSYKEARKRGRKVMAVVQEKDSNGGPVFKWRKVPLSRLSEEEFLAWKFHWMNTIREGFGKCVNQIKRDLSESEGGKEKLAECIRILDLKRKAAEIEV